MTLKRRLAMDYDRPTEHATMDDSAEDVGSPTRDEEQLQAGLDYYLENGLFVFTAAFLRKRGYCCESGCRHCPYQTANCSPPAS